MSSTGGSAEDADADADVLAEDAEEEQPARKPASATVHTHAPAIFQNFFMNIPFSKDVVITIFFYVYSGLRITKFISYVKFRNSLN